MLSSRQFLLIVLAVACWSVLVLTVYARFNPPTDTTTAARTVQADLAARINEVLYQSLNDADRQAEEILDDLSKYRFRPLLEPLRELRLVRDTFGERVQQVLNHDLRYAEFSPARVHERLLDLHGLHQRFLHRHTRAMLEHYRTHAEVYAFGPDDLAAVEGRLERAVADSEAKDLVATPPSDHPDARLRVAALEQVFLLAVRELQFELINWGCYRGCFWGPFHFPLIQQQKAVGRRGEAFPLNISVASVEHTIDPQAIYFVVAGDTLRPGQDGSVDYLAPTDRRGERSVDVALYVTNPLTGEVRRSETTRKYFVR